MTDLIEVTNTTAERAWESSRGKLIVRTPTRGVVVFIETGFLHDDFAEKLTTSLDAALAVASKLEIFVDAAKLEGYSPLIRIAPSDWLKAHIHQVTKQHMLVASRITRMGLSVASLALGGVLVGYTDQAAFEKELARASRNAHTA